MIFHPKAPLITLFSFMSRVIDSNGVMTRKKIVVSYCDRDGGLFHIRL